MNRPPLSADLSPSDFRAHRWLKAELIDFCEQFSLPTDGNKHTLKRRVMAFLRSNALQPE